ncbi:hypothetical protein D9615_000752 [Tricholomella constricta]|uniref:GP-PDE domain-containing protein n=1 Tax=Tricholomella constricta TaxID=117010 RepID=A0A8H5MAT6_9AGAR|nr:hypothetical protein D9615_000752 [Tricholomella constricta]
MDGRTDANPNANVFFFQPPSWSWFANQNPRFWMFASQRIKRGLRHISASFLLSIPRPLLARSLSYMTLPQFKLTRNAAATPRELPGTSIDALAPRKSFLIASPLPDCWGHRGASARYPENTLASFEAAIRDGAEGIESDVHVSADNVVVMFHDPGQIKERDWHGEQGMQHVRTVKEPKQAIPTFAETVALLMRPENQHVKFNVDVKVQNDPDRLFALMHETIAAQPGWETLLAPRILLGLWHPRFLAYAKTRLSYCRRSYIGDSPYIARKYFWADCDAFSMAFGALTTADGQRFRMECKAAGKKLMVWTVNKPDHMMEARLSSRFRPSHRTLTYIPAFVQAVRWEVNVIITDVTKTWLDMRTALQTDYEKIGSQYGRIFLWTTPRFYTPFLLAHSKQAQIHLERIAGPFDAIPVTHTIKTQA